MNLFALRIFKPSHIFVLCLLALLAACGQPAPQVTPEPGEATLKTASFTGTADYNATGALSFVQQGSKQILRFADNFQVSAGPDLHVWLIKDTNDLSDVTELGRLIATSGSQEYSLPGDFELADYSHVYIWCRGAGQLFGEASLTSEPPTAPVEPAPTNPTPSEPAPEIPAPSEPGNPPATPAPPANPPAPQVILQGSFTLDSSGSVQIVQTGSTRTLELNSDFMANGTNDISVWLAEDSSGSGFIDLGRIETSGAQRVTLPENIDFETLNHVIIWCNRFPSVIGDAVLQ